MTTVPLDHSRRHNNNITQTTRDGHMQHRHIYKHLTLNKNKTRTQTNIHTIINSVLQKKRGVGN